MDTRREFLKKASLLSGGAGILNILPASVAKAMAIDPDAGTTFMDADHIVFLMQENRSFDHTYGTLQGVRGYNDPRAIVQPDRTPVWFQSNKKGETYAPFRLDIKNTNATWMESLPHSWTDQVDARNHGHYNQWLDNKHSHVDKYVSMPLTLGFYSREDIPFYYSIADAFTVCDHNFCSSLTGTTPNRLYFWTGTIWDAQHANSFARVWNGDADEDTSVKWKTFPERLEEAGISWKIYQNEISTNSGLKEDHDAWLSNFGDNPIEAFAQYNVRSAAADLSGTERAIHEKAFSNNSKDPDYRELTTLKYKDDDGTEHEVKVPKGDVFHQFREDVNSGNLPTVSWLVAPQAFSDHPSSAWYGAWYISEALDILTHKPKVWKKTIFILTYDENDGYYDHLPPFVAPHPQQKNTGKVSSGIDTSLDYIVSASQQSSTKEDIRMSPIGLGYRVPMVIASPWSRGGWVNSQVFDHTSSLRFLEKFLSQKFNKQIEEPNISSWRRAVCGDLTSVFRPYNGGKAKKPDFLERDEFIEAIHKAQFRNNPSNFRQLSNEEKEKAKADGGRQHLPVQEKGTRESNALPYELFANGKLSDDRRSFIITMGASNKIFGDTAAGSPFTVYAHGKNGEMTSRSYAVKAGDEISDEWPLDDFDGNRYHLKVYGPNGFFREFKGSSDDPGLTVTVKPPVKRSNVANFMIKIECNVDKPVDFEITDNTYKTEGARQKSVNNKSAVEHSFPLTASHGWYDYSLKTAGNDHFEMRFAGRIENGFDGRTDPAMGGEI